MIPPGSCVTEYSEPFSMSRCLRCNVRGLALLRNDQFVMTTAP